MNCKKNCLQFKWWIIPSAHPNSEIKTKTIALPDYLVSDLFFSSRGQSIILLHVRTSANKLFPYADGKTVYSWYR